MPQVWEFNISHRTTCDALAQSFAALPGANEQPGNGFMLDRILPICPEPTKLLRAKLQDSKLKRRMFEKILGLATQAGDNDALQIAIDLVDDAAGDPELKLEIGLWLRLLG